jgi:23S rRNA (adenine2503-C2)-methyltransferase
MQIEKKDIRAVSKDLLRNFLWHKETKLFANQVYEWLWSKGAHSFEDMTNISKETRTMLESNFVINPLKWIRFNVLTTER